MVRITKHSLVFSKMMKVISVGGAFRYKPEYRQILQLYFYWYSFHIFIKMFRFFFTCSYPYSDTASLNQLVNIGSR